MDVNKKILELGDLALQLPDIFRFNPPLTDEQIAEFADSLDVKVLLELNRALKELEPTDDLGNDDHLASRFIGHDLNSEICIVNG
ncbi:MAG: hypothetical protein ABIJ08_00695 [Nanoarchaeota archaeon]